MPSASGTDAQMWQLDQALWNAVKVALGKGKKNARYAKRIDRMSSSGTLQGLSPLRESTNRVIILRSEYSPEFGVS